MTPERKFSRFPKVKNLVVRGAFLLTVSGIVALHTGCGSSASEEQQWETVTEKDPTQGVVTTVEEVEKDLFKITGEDIVEKKADSRIIAKYMDGKVDTLTLEEAKLVEKDKSRSGLSRAFMGGLMGYYLGRSMSTPLNRNSYKNQAGFAKSNTVSKNTLSRSAKTRTVKKPVTGRSGFGKSGGGSSRGFSG